MYTPSPAANYSPVSKKNNFKSLNNDVIIIAITLIIIIRHHVTIAHKSTDHPRETEPVSTKRK